MKTALLAAAMLAALPGAGIGAPPIYSVTDVSHEYTYYFDGRFGRQYLSEDSRDTRNWGTLAKMDLRGANLLVIAAGATPCPYSPRDMLQVRYFLELGGAVLVLGDFSTFKGELTYRVNDLLAPVGAEFVDHKLVAPLHADPSLRTGTVVAREGKAIQLYEPETWEILVTDSEGKVAMARRKVLESGTLIIASRSLAGCRPDAADCINEDMWKLVLADATASKVADPSKPPRTTLPENTASRNGLRLQYSDYMKPYADAVFGLYREQRPALQRILGVPPLDGTLANLMLVPMRGGGFCRGDSICIGAFYREFPEEKYGMIETLGHEGAHSRLEPVPEPMWAEAFATYIGITLGRQAGLTKQADSALNGWIAGARSLDPGLNAIDIREETRPPHAVVMGKSMWIWSQLAKERPDIVARYLQARRRLIIPEEHSVYTADDCVAVLSNAMGRDLFPWFRSVGIKVDASRTKVPLAG